MVKERSFLKGVLVLALVFAVFLAGCSNDTTFPAVMTIIPPNVGAPVVTAKAVNTGVLLSWPAVIDTQRYEVWRSGGGQTSAKELTNNASGNLTEGIIYYLDAVNFDNPLKSNTLYTYTVVAIPNSGAKDTGRTDVLATTGTLLDPGAKAVQPEAVDLEINYGTKSVTVTITPPTSGNIPNGYAVSLPDGSPATIILDNGSTPVTTTVAYGSSSNFVQSYTGDITVTVTGYLGSPFYSSSYYYQTADVYTYKKTVEPLFGTSIYGYGTNYISVSSTHTYTSPTSYAVTGFGTGISLANVTPQPDVTYTIERAKQTNNPGANWDWTTPTLYSTSSTGGTTVSLTQDIFGNFPAFNESGSIVYDRSLPVEEGTWGYRLKAVKDGITDYLPVVTKTIDFWTVLQSVLSINVTGETSSTTTYTISPSLDRDFQNMLQDDDKLVVYYVRGDANAWRYGAYTAANSVSFSKSELSGATINSKTFSVANPAGSNTNVYVQVYLESPNKESKVITSLLTGSAVDYYNRQNGINGQIHWGLVY